MDTKLKRARKLLRSESCPPQVLEQVCTQVAEQRRQQGFRVLAYAMALLVASVATVIIFHQQRWQREQVAEQQRIAAQACLSLVYVGHQLQETGSDTGKRILEGTIPGLVRGYRTATAAFIKP